GTVWTSELISSIVHEGDLVTLKARRMLDRVPWLECIPDDPLFRKSDSLNTGKKNLWFTHLSLERLPTDIREGKCKLVYVARNPKDQAVSNFHFHKLNDSLGQQADLTWSEFFSLNCSGNIYFGSWFDHVLSFWKFTRNNPNTKFIFFEDMKKDLISQVKEIEEFVGVPLTDEQRSRVVQHCSFSSMRENKMVNGTTAFDEKIGKFMRKGEIGDWKNHFTVAQNEAFDELFETKMEGSGIKFTF
ncbi:hypothetical protein PMAYCL1PPCAC_00146, partial [Pristionchus mayeri]